VACLGGQCAYRVRLAQAGHHGPGEHRPEARTRGRRGGDASTRRAAAPVAQDDASCVAQRAVGDAGAVAGGQQTLVCEGANTVTGERVAVVIAGIRVLLDAYHA